MGRAPLPAAPEPRLSADFASRAIAKADHIRSRRRRTKIALATTTAAALALLFWMRPVAENHNPAKQDSITSPSETTYASSDEDSDLLTMMMPDARQAENFDANYGPAGWPSYASWNPISSDSYR